MHSNTLQTMKKTDDEDEPAHNDHDDWMLCYRLNHRYATNSESTANSFDWSAFARSLTP